MGLTKEKHLTVTKPVRGAVANMAERVYVEHHSGLLVCCEAARRFGLTPGGPGSTEMYEENYERSCDVNLMMGGDFPFLDFRRGARPPISLARLTRDMRRNSLYVINFTEPPGDDLKERDERLREEGLVR